MQSIKLQNRTIAMTLIEVLVALTIASFVFSSLLQMAFDALKRAKVLELQDKMRNYATEVVQVVYNSKDTDWDKSFGDPTPPASPAIPAAVVNAIETQLPLGFLNVTATDSKPELATLSYDVCHFEPIRGVLEGSDCAKTAASEPTNSATTKKFFGRIIRRLDNDNVDFLGEKDTINDASIEIIVACIDKMCDGTNFKPFKLNFQVYRTSGP